MPPLVGLIPAAGRATRLGLDQESKEVLPVDSEFGSRRPVIGFLLEAMGEAGIGTAFVVLREGKWDIPTTLGRRAEPRWPALAYIMTPGTDSIPRTVDCSYRFLRRADIVLGFADVCFAPKTALAELVEAHRHNSADVTLALFASDRPDKTDMVEIDGKRVTAFRIKPGACELEYTWIAASWDPPFTRFLHQFLRGEPQHEQGKRAELQMSETFAAAIESGLSIKGLIIPGGRFIDVGTREDLERVSKRRVEGSFDIGKVG